MSSLWIFKGGVFRDAHFQDGGFNSLAVDTNKSNVLISLAVTMVGFRFSAAFGLGLSLFPPFGFLGFRAAVQEMPIHWVSAGLERVLTHLVAFGY